MIFQTFLQSKKWQDKDPSVRLKAIADLHHSGDSESADAAEAAGILAQMARKDPDRVVRLATIAHVVSLDDLDALRSRNGLDPSLVEDVVLGCVDPVGEADERTAEAPARGTRRHQPSQAAFSPTERPRLRPANRVAERSGDVF